MKIAQFPIVLVSFFFLKTTFLQAQTILRVNVNTPCTSGCDGSSWALAYPSLSSAIAAFTSGEIWVAVGTYKPGASRTDAFDLKNNMAIYGGFNGTEGSRNARNVANNPTILSGDVNGNDVGMANNGENNYHVLIAIKKTGVVVDGFTVIGGNANVSGTNYGGGFYAQQCEATVQNCIFDTNNATNGGAIAWHIPNYDPSPTSNFTLKDCTFKNNRGTYAGAVGLFLEKGATTSVIENCLFQYNEGTGASVGGAIAVQLGAAAVGTLNSTIKGCRFKNNAASYGGVMIFGQNTGSLITNTVVNCVFNNNSGVFGGVMNNLVGQQIFKNCLFFKNTAAYGEAITTPEAAQFINCTFSGNAGQGSTCFHNTAAATSFTNCIFWNQTSPIDNSSATVNYCNVQGGWATGTGNINVDPQFLDTPNDNFQLKCTSTSRNVGNNAANTETLDLGGNTRIQETTIDLGAYESDGGTLGIAIANTAFANAIRADCASCINGANVLTCAVLSRTSLNLSGQSLTDVSGISHFSSLTTLNVANNNLSSLPTLPSSLTHLNLSNNNFISLPTTLPSNLIELQLQNNAVTCLPTLPNSLTTLSFDAADIPCIPNKPSALVTTAAVCATITNHPSVNNTFCNGSPANLTAMANSTSPMTVKWQRKGASDAVYSDVSAATAYNSNTNATYTFTPTSADNNALYRAVFAPVCSGVTTTSGQVVVINDLVPPSTTTNNSLSFDGINDFVQIMNCSGAAFPFTDAITIEFWFKGSNMQSAVRFQPDADTYIVMGWNNSKHIISTSGGTNGVNIGTGATDGSWHHVAMTWQKGVTSGFIPYLDGVRGTRRSAANVNLPTMTSGFYLGANQGTSEFMNGTIDEVRIWNVARTQAQIQAAMSSELSLPQTGLVMYYKFNHGTGNGTNTVNTTANVVSSTSYTGGLQNFALTGASSNFSSATPFTILPVELVNFSGYTEGGKNILKWQTATETGVSHFDIERSEDGQFFETIGTVKSLGSNTGYQFSDDTKLSFIHYPLSSNFYYRLKINDLDGKTNLSKIILIEKKGKAMVKIYPSVTNDFLTIENAKSIEIVNSIGQVVVQKSLGSLQGFLSLGHLPNGFYLVKGVDTEGGIFSEKIIKN